VSQKRRAYASGKKTLQASLTSRSWEGLGQKSHKKFKEKPGCLTCRSRVGGGGKSTLMFVPVEKKKDFLDADNVIDGGNAEWDSNVGERNGAKKRGQEYCFSFGWTTLIQWRIA